ncbi:bifunctional glutamate--cysteine ligase GshA/glutathione synthetase GshB [Carnobacteriaceae bacterium zg-ZUI252]|nr:bifunctional glutamate--cysteine ligase GshA/glutathione synthetase GshB [Carnobacteriaceae bacterium zg-ZUI252]MBS4769899.1 bifunctional glutamate--cysteine ligase GshA/glutathione synthetase GshB [Carnobacteriaceae bacterium zg-ZUI240]
MSYKQRIIEQELFSSFQLSSIGIEKEGQRLTKKGELSNRMHPQRFADRSYHPYIQTDYAESQLELITPVTKSVEEATMWLHALHEVTLKEMAEDEIIWPMSMLAKLPDDNDIIEAQMDPTDIAYRQYLTKKYGKQKQMVSGIHFNYGFDETFLDSLLGDDATIADRNAFYMHIARQFLRYQWILVYLFGTSIDTPAGYYTTTQPPQKLVRSLRASHHGYVNDATIRVPFTSIEAYANAITQYVQNGDLIAEKEFYSSVRFRGQKSVADFVEKGISYIEFRLFDINPFSPVGISVEDARFIQLFIQLMVYLDEADAPTNDYTQQTALQHPLDAPVDMKEAQWVMEQMLEMIDVCHFPASDRDVVLTRLEWLSHPEQTLGGQLVMATKDQDMLAFGLSKAVEYKANFLQRPYGIQAFDKMELSTQALLEDAIVNGLHIEILDANDQFLTLRYGEHKEYVKNGNMTSHDNYISPLMMENKVVTKKVLSQANFRVPNSQEVQSIEQAIDIYPLIKDNAIVIKPKSTNYGLGITIFQEATYTKEDFLKAVEIALTEDKDVMIEEFIKGTEYRFFVIGDETKAVLLRVGAHVIGDGIHTIEQLVSIKNDNALRGDGSKTPLKKIVIGDIETLQLKEQGYTKETIVPEGDRVVLRANSNISTGGDSVDMTDKMHDSYKMIAQGVAKAMFAKVCGVDLMIDDYTKDASHSKTSYGVIEANFNPMMMMHIYPAVGLSRRLTIDILKMLFPELSIR